MSEMQFSTFYLDNARFGVDIILVREINRQLQITPVHKLSEYVRGLINLRGQIVTVLDLGIKLGIGAREITEHSRCIILKTREDMALQDLQSRLGDEAPTDLVGLLVDRIGDVVTIDHTDIESPPANVGEIDGTFMNGVVKLDGELLSILKLQKVCE